MTPEQASEFTRFIQNPTAEAFGQLYAAVTSQPEFDGYSDELTEAQNLLSRGDFAGARTRLNQSMNCLLLSPAAHMVAAYAAMKSGDDRGAQVEHLITHALFAAILATGDGSSEKPYLVSRIRDEYEILNHLGKTSKLQSAVKDGDLFLDCHECSDGSRICFDVTVLKRQLDRRLRGGK